MSDAPAGWNFADSGSMPWQPMGEGIAMKTLGMAGGRMIATFQFQPGYEGGVHDHTDAEFTYILEGSLISQGVLMTAGHAYAAIDRCSPMRFQALGGVREKRQSGLSWSKSNPGISPLPNRPGRAGTLGAS